MTRMTVENPQHVNANQTGAVIAQDIRGYQLFSQGEIGEAHRTAHEMFDSGQIASGHRKLGKFLADHSGHGSDWLHLQFHMVVFELELGGWQAAYTRFRNEILPAATSTREALTDAPSLLWRLRINAPKGVLLPWQPLRRTVLTGPAHTESAFVQIHHLLALAGAGDTVTIDAWPTFVKATGDSWLVAEFSRFCSVIARHCFSEAGKRLEGLRADLARLDGSHAQLQLFDQLDRWIEQKIQGGPEFSDYLDAA